jgi:hypothetical protein
MAKHLIKSTDNNTKPLDPFDFYYNGLTIDQLKQAKDLLKSSKEKYQAEQVDSEDMNEPTYQYKR